jgi:hypothetical protein
VAHPLEAGQRSRAEVSERRRLWVQKPLFHQLCNNRQKMIPIGLLSTSFVATGTWIGSLQQYS